MAERYFVFLYPAESILKSYLDLAIFLLNPNEKWPAHVTVAGPFKNRRKFLINRRHMDTSVFVLSRGNFFAHGQNTVFLNVGFPGLSRVWKKPDFKGNPIPHITIYDGKDAGFAEEVFTSLAKIRFPFSFEARDLQVVNAVSGQSRSDLRVAVNPSVLPETAGLALDGLKMLPRTARLNLAMKALSLASKKSDQSLLSLG